jgi:2-polyprenyl-6-methoxyphenol hydroxylase-like FAD-dependent oxidoreductase
MVSKTDAYDVVISGSGPVGTSLAIDLAWRGVRVAVVEERAQGELPSVKCNHVAARTMEFFRRLGVSQEVRNSGLPPHYPHDVAFRTTVTGIEFARIPIPCRAERFTTKGTPDGWWPTPELPHRINQIYLEPILTRHAASLDNVDVFNRTTLEGYVQDDHGVVATVRDLDTGESRKISAQYLVGCDGARSVVRKAIGAKLSGTEVVQRVQSTYFKAPDLIARMGSRPAWMMMSVNPRRNAVTVAIDGKENWLIHNYLLPEEKDFDDVDRDWAIRTILGVGPDFEYEILSQEDWIGRRLVADKFRDRRVFICGDSAHLWIPFAGYGMNAGIADAMNLSWTLAARINGWGGETILEAYEAERLPITEQVSRHAMDIALGAIGQRRSVPASIEDASEEGDRIRRRFGQQVYDLNVQQFCCGGLNFGYFYDASPVLAYDGDAAPTYSLYDFKQSSVPGCRTPHVWLASGQSLYDALGPEFTLLRLDPQIDVAPLLAAAAQRGMPIVVLDVDAPDAAAIYGRRLVLSRPDQHVAWRGDALPEDPLALVDLVRGALPVSETGFPKLAQTAALSSEPVSA